MKQNQWTSRIGFLLATAGAAIGLGNLWKFPYLMGRNGGFFFLLAYLIFIVLLGLPVMMLEMSLGRYSGENAVASYRRVHPRAGIVGFLGVLAAFIILSYYSVIGGWILKYFFSYLTTLRHRPALTYLSAAVRNRWYGILSLWLPLPPSACLASKVSKRPVKS